MNEMQTDGTEKEVKRSFFVDAETFTEAETMIAEELGTTNVKSMAFVDFNNFISIGNEGKFFKVDINSILLDEVTAKEKKIRLSYLVASESVTEATNTINEKKMDCEEIKSVKELNIADILKGIQFESMTSF